MENDLKWNRNVLEFREQWESWESFNPVLLLKPISVGLKQARLQAQFIYFKAC